jgi:hypothetical protein
MPASSPGCRIWSRRCWWWGRRACRGSRWCRAIRGADLTTEDLPSCPWLASAPYLASVAKGLERARRGEADYLAASLARALYERLGYVAYGREPASWATEAADGSLTHYETVCALMRKELP